MSKAVKKNNDNNANKVNVSQPSEIVNDVEKDVVAEPVKEETAVKAPEKKIAPEKKNVPEKKTKVKKTKKKSLFVKGLIAVVAAGIIGVIIASVKYFGTDAQARCASTTIEFTYDGAAMNKTPSGEKFSISGLSGDKVITAALQKCNYYGKYTTEDIQKCIVIDGSYPDDIIDKIKQYNSLFDFSASREVSVNEYFPTIFTLTLYDDFDPSISDSDLKNLCNSIVNTYKNYFMVDYVNAFDISDIDELLIVSKYDYSQRIKILSFRAKLLQKYASELYTEKPDFRFNEMTFNDLYFKCSDLINNSLTKVDALVTMNALSTDSTRLRNQYEYEIKTLQNKLKNDQACLEEIDSLISKYETNDILYISSGDNVTKIDSNSTETYETLMDLRSEVTDKITETTTDIERYKLYLEDINGNSGSSVKTLIEDTERITGEVQQQLDKLEVMFKDMISAYNKTLVSDDSIEVSATGFTAPRLLSGGFIVQIIKCAGPLCMIVLILCCLYGFLLNVRKYKNNI